jgi:hypothetical protein
MADLKGDGFRDADWVWACLRKAYEAETGATVGAMDTVFENDGTVLDGFEWQAIRGSYEVGEFRGVMFEHDADDVIEE